MFGKMEKVVGPWGGKFLYGGCENNHNNIRSTTMILLYSVRRYCMSV